MNINYDSYLDRGTKSIMSFFSSEKISLEEKEAIASAFTEELINNIGNIEGLRDCDPLIYTAAVHYNDGVISRILTKNDASYSDYELGINSCLRQQQSFAMFVENGWSIPQIENPSPEKCAELFQKRQESISIGNKILDEDQQIDKMIALAEKELSVSICDQVTTIVHEFERDIAICKQKQISVPVINNNDTQAVINRIALLRQSSEQKEAIHKELYDNDLQIHLILSGLANMPDQWKKLVLLSQKQEVLLSDCRKRKWPLPALRYSQPDKISVKYQHYLNMHEVDEIIANERDTLATNAQYNEFFKQCKTQQDNINACLQRGWLVPNLSNPDPASLSIAVQAEKKRKDKRRHRRITLCLIGVALIAAAFLVLFCIHQYKASLVQVPFDAADAIGQDQNNIYKELEEAGFTSIEKKQDYSGWQEGDKVISVKIDNSKEFVAGASYKPDVNIVLTYSSSDRVDVTDVLRTWQGAEYERLISSLKVKGFSNIEATPKETENRLQNRRVISISLNNISYSSGECYLPKSAPIRIEYYILQIKIGQTAKQLEDNQMYTQVVNRLEAQGFINIRLQRANDIGWFPIHSPEGSVKQLTIDGIHDFTETDTFRYDAEIIIVVHTREGQGFEEITEIAK